MQRQGFGDGSPGRQGGGSRDRKGRSTRFWGPSRVTDIGLRQRTPAARESRNRVLCHGHPCLGPCFRLDEPGPHRRLGDVSPVLALAVCHPSHGGGTLLRRAGGYGTRHGGNCPVRPVELLARPVDGKEVGAGSVRSQAGEARAPDRKRRTVPRLGGDGAPDWPDESGLLGGGLVVGAPGGFRSGALAGRATTRGGLFVLRVDLARLGLVTVLSCRFSAHRGDLDSPSPTPDYAGGCSVPSRGREAARRDVFFCEGAEVLLRSSAR